MRDRIREYDTEGTTISHEMRIVADRSLYLRDTLEIDTSKGVIHDARVALCRRGVSRNRPFCDGLHEQAGFRAA